MTDLWYYAEGDETRGPLSLSELLPVLGRIPDPRLVMIWKPGFADWKTVEEVREVAQQLFRPPPLRPPQTPPVVQQTHAPAVTAQDAAEFKDVKPELTGLGGWLTLLGFGLVVGLLRFLVTIGEYYNMLSSELWARFPTALWGEVVMNTFLVWLFVYTAVLFFRRSRLFPRFFIWQFVAVICTPMLQVCGLD